MSLHDQLQQIADSAPRPAIDHAVWDRGRVLRRRDRLVKSAVVLAMVVVLGGFVAVVTGPPRAFAPAGDTVAEGAIPSRIYDAPGDLPAETDLAIGRSSVSFVGGDAELDGGFGFPIVVGAIDGRYHRLDLPGVDIFLDLPPALSPDGMRLAWASPQAHVVRVADLETGEITTFDLEGRPGPVRWTPGGDTLLVPLTLGLGDAGAARIDISTGEVSRVRATVVNTTGYPSPDGSVSVVPSNQLSDATFITTDGRTLSRTLPADVYPDGAAVEPLGWTDDHLVLASKSAVLNQGDSERHLILFTSPDRPKSEWTFRIVARDVPGVPLSVAVDLIPDLDGTSSQQLTHDFGEPDWPGQGPDRLPLILGALVALLSGLAFVRMLRHQH